MPKLRIERFYYRNGQIHVEQRMVNGQLHGLQRTWHHNGRLAKELRYHHGLLHGLNRQWNHRGKLLGSFDMKRGTGLQKYFHENGQLKMEVSTVNGQFHGRTRMWMYDGTLTFERFRISDRDVSRSAYLKAAASHPEWPQYAGEPAGRVMRDGKKQERRTVELFFQSVMDQVHEEALVWFKSGKPNQSLLLGKFRSAKSAVKFVESLYAVGAQKVIAGPIYSGKKGRLYADLLFIELPKARSKRSALRSICEDFVRKCRGALLPENDIHEKCLCLSLAP